jgi:hypothetical protein
MFYARSKRPWSRYLIERISRSLDEALCRDSEASLVELAAYDMRELFIQRFDEEIREIAEFPGYWASNLGRIISAPKLSGQSKWIILQGGYLMKSGHLNVTLRRDGKNYKRTIHNLVGRAFNDFSGSGSQWRHLDSDQTNNRADNLKWGTPLEDRWDLICDNRK